MTANVATMASNGTPEPEKVSREAVFAAAVARGQSIREASKLVGISRRSGARLSRDPAVLSRVSEYRRRMVRTLLGSGLTGAAIGMSRLTQLAASADEDVAYRASAKLIAFAERIVVDIAKRSVSQEEAADAVEAVVRVAQRLGVDADQLRAELRAQSRGTATEAVFNASEMVAQSMIEGDDADLEDVEFLETNIPPGNAGDASAN